MRAAGGFERDGGKAVGAVFGRGRRGRRLFSFLKAISHAHHQEDGKGHDQEINDGVDEQPVVEGWRSSLLSGGQGEIGRAHV